MSAETQNAIAFTMARPQRTLRLLPVKKIKKIRVVKRVADHEANWGMAAPKTIPLDYWLKERLGGAWDDS